MFPACDYFLFFILLKFDKEPCKEFPNEYCCFIIETGFNLFILYSHFQELETKGGIYYYDLYSYADGNIAKEKEYETMQKGNILSSLGNLGINLLLG